MSAHLGRVRSIVASLFKGHLLATNVSLSFGLSGLGDLLQQRNEMVQKQGTASPSSGLRRATHMAVTFGATSGVLCHFWYHWLDAFLPGSGLRVVVRKIVLDQVLFSPVCIAACLSASCLLDGATSAHQLTEEVLHKGSRLYVAEWAIWPPAQFLNFYFLPTRFRVLFDNLVSLGYDVYASNVKHQTPPKTIAIREGSVGERGKCGG